MYKPNAQLTHVGLYVRDMDAMMEFYCKHLALLVVDRGFMNGTELCFLSRNENEHHQVVLARVPDREPSGPTTLNQVSFRLETLSDLQEFYRSLLPHNLPGMEARHHGNSWSYYFFDPEGNKIEMYAVTAWQVQQPWRAPLDLLKPVDEIMAETEAYIRQLDSARPLEEWRQDMRNRLSQQRRNP